MSSALPSGHLANPVTRPVNLSEILRGSVRGADGTAIGSLTDVIVRLRPSGYPHVSGLVVRIGQNTVFVPIDRVATLSPGAVQLNTKTLDLRPFERRDGEVLLNDAVLGHRVIDIEHARLVRAYDVALVRAVSGWQATGLDVHRRGWFRRRGHGQHLAQDWTRFDALIGHEASARLRGRFGRIRRLRPAQIADIIESASTHERDDLMDQLHENPDLEADVFEELDDTPQRRLLKTRSTEDVAGVLSRMRPDDAVDALIDLPHERRQPVLQALPADKRADIMRLMRYQGSTAGGLMGDEFVAVADTASVAEALAAVRAATGAQPEALTTIHLLDDLRRLTGTISLVAAVQADPTRRLAEIADAEPVFALPHEDMIEISNIMADYNLLTLPILDTDRTLLGVITVDDALEAVIPDDWRHRERRARPDIHD